MRPLVRLYGSESVDDFGPRKLKAVRQAMIEDDLSRGLINARVNRIRRMFKWGVENELVEPSVLHALQAVAPLKRGRCSARETPPVKPADRAIVEAALPHMTSPVRAKVQLQLLTGMRPGEVVIMRTCDIDTSEDT